MKCVSINNNSQYKEGEEYEFKPLDEGSLVTDNDYWGRNTRRTIEAVNALVEENEKRINSINSLGGLVLNQQSIINHLISRIEALEKVVANR